MPGGIFVRISVKTLVTSVCRACFYSVCVCQWLYFLGQLPNLERLQKYFCLISPIFFVSVIKLYFNFPFSCCVILNYHSAPLVQSSTNKADLNRVKNDKSGKKFATKKTRRRLPLTVSMKSFGCEDVKNKEDPECSYLESDC